MGDKMPKRYKKNNPTKNIILFCTISIILVILIVYLYDTYNDIELYQSNYNTQKTQSTIKEQTVEEELQNSIKTADVLENVLESVVGISKLKEAGTSIFSNSDESELGLGTGLIVTENGYVLSNEHVTGSKNSTCYITLETGGRYTGIVVWSDSDLDLSITKIEAKNLRHATLGDSDNVRIGETVYAIGNPIGFEFRRTVTSGIISGKNRSIKLKEDNTEVYMSDLIQTDATINPGNSGGPLIYPSGEVIGINTVKITSAESIGFAVPINVVKSVIESFKNEDNFEQATLGIYAYDKDVIPYLNNSTNFEKGIYIAEIIKNSPASKVDLKEGDIILSIDGMQMNTMNDLREYIYSKKPSDEVILKIKRKNILRQIKIVLGKK